MRKNSVFWGMLGLSAALHGLVIIGSGSGFRTPSPVFEKQIVTTLNMMKGGATPKKPVPSTPIEKKIVEKAVEIPPELPVQDPIPDEEIRENHETQVRESGNDEEARESDGTQEYDDTGNTEKQEGETGEGAAITDREYEALLVYIKDFIDKNLVYPPMAQRRNIQGVVALRFEIEGSGVIGAIVTDRSSGSSILDNAAVSLVKKIPPLKNLALNRTLALRVNIEYELTE
jgi:TonB family protein